MKDITEIRKNFPILARKINGKPLIYFDNAATSQTPKCVVDALQYFYFNTRSNIHRGIHTLSEETTEEYEKTRQKIADFINAQSSAEIIFTRNATESINLVANTWAEKNIHAGDEILISILEHHSNFVPWQQFCQRKKVILKIAPIKNDFTVDYEIFTKLLTSKTKLVAITGMSNALGTVINTKKIVQLAHERGAKVLIDGAQSICHFGADMRKINCDFFVFSAHKMLGPTGVGILYAKKELLEVMPPFLYGGDMIKSVREETSLWNDIPWKFEAGTPNIADVIAFGKAIEFITQVGFDFIQKNDENLLNYAKEKFSKYPKIKIFSPENPANRASILSFTLDGVHPHDIATIFNDEGIAIRSGQHCAEPLMKSLNIPATARMSFYLYNTKEEIDVAEKALQKTMKIFMI